LTGMGAAPDLSKLRGAFSTFDVHDYEDVLRCMRCGFCLPTCPTYRTDGVETQSPRGRVAMIKAVVDGRMDPTEEFAEHMYHCLDCRNCHTVCPAGVTAGELVLEARHRIEEHRPQGPVKRYLLRVAVRDQRRLSRLLAPARLYQRSGIQGLVRKYDFLGGVSAGLSHMEAMMPRIPDRPLTETLPREIPAHGREKGRVGFFLGCAMNLLYPEASRDTAWLLSRSGFTVVTPKAQQCCGAPNIEEGERAVYREMAESNVELFLGKDVDFVVTDCAACGNELKSYGKLLGGSGRDPRNAVAFSGKVRDVSEFLAGALGAETSFGTVDGSACFHDPCHLCHAQGITGAPRDLLRRVPGLRLSEIPDAGQCCGSAGVYNLTHVDRSMKILGAKVEAIGNTGAGTVVSSNPGCLLQLGYAKRRFRTDWEVVHISRILRRSIERGEKKGGSA
jgi:glycolate oxidase iron-sulfur subunit